MENEKFATTGDLAKLKEELLTRMGDLASKEELKALEKRYGELQRELEELKEDFNEVKNEVKTNSDRSNSLDTRVHSLEERISGLEERVSRLEEQVSRLVDEIVDMKLKMTSFVTKDEFHAKMDSLLIGQDKIINLLLTMQTEQKAMIAAMARMESRFDKLDEINHLQNERLDALENRIEKLELRLP